MDKLPIDLFSEDEFQERLEARKSCLSSIKRGKNELTKADTEVAVWVSAGNRVHRSKF